MSVKYIAAGFYTDANKLINEFIDQKSLDFKTFCTLWKKHKFSYVLMGRPNLKEFTQFVNEIYQLVLNNMNESSMEYKIGVLCGPCRTSTRVNYMRPNICESGLVKTDMLDLHKNNTLQDLQNLHCQYLNQRESIQQNGSSAPQEVSNKYKELIGGLASLVEDKNSSENIGSRRRQLKKTSYETKTHFRQLNPGETKEIPQPSSKKIIKRTRRVPPDQRRVGRPRKKEESEEDLDESAMAILNEAMASISTATTRRRTTRKNVTYIEESDDEYLVNLHLPAGDCISDTSEDSII